MLGVLISFGGACAGDGSSPGADRSIDWSTTTTTAIAEAPVVPTTEPPQSGGPPSTAIVGASKAPSAPANQTQLDHPSGVRLILTVAGRLRYRHDANLAMSLKVRNISGSVVHHDSNQDLNFAMYREGGGEAGWTDRSCDWQIRYGEVPTTGPLALDPGEEVEFVEEYPVPPSGRDAGVGPDPASCRVSPGRYAVIGFFDHCPPGAMATAEYNGKPYCDRAKVERIASRPVTIEIIP